LTTKQPKVKFGKGKTFNRLSDDRSPSRGQQTATDGRIWKGING
jgi:hypothetical protein